MTQPYFDGKIDIGTCSGILISDLENLFVRYIDFRLEVKGLGERVSEPPVDRGRSHQHFGSCSDHHISLAGRHYRDLEIRGPVIFGIQVADQRNDTVKVCQTDYLRCPRDSERKGFTRSDVHTVGCPDQHIVGIIQRHSVVGAGFGIGSHIGNGHCIISQTAYFRIGSRYRSTHQVML